MQMSVDDTVDMVAVRNRAMSTRSVVRMARGVSGGRIGRRAASRIHLARAENVLVDVSLVAAGARREDSPCGLRVRWSCARSRNDSDVSPSLPAGRPLNEHDAEEVGAVFLDAMNGTRHRLDAHPWRVTFIASRNTAPTSSAS